MSVIIIADVDLILFFSYVTLVGVVGTCCCLIYWRSVCQRRRAFVLLWHAVALPVLIFLLCFCFCLFDHI